MDGRIVRYGMLIFLAHVKQLPLARRFYSASGDKSVSSKKR